MALKGQESTCKGADEAFCRAPWQVQLRHSDALLLVGCACGTEELGAQPQRAAGEAAGVRAWRACSCLHSTSVIQALGTALCQGKLKHCCW